MVEDLHPNLDDDFVDGDSCPELQQQPRGGRLSVIILNIVVTTTLPYYWYHGHISVLSELLRPRGRVEFEDRPDLEGEGGGASAYIGQHDVDVDGEDVDDEDQNDDHDEHQGGGSPRYRSA